MRVVSLNFVATILAGGLMTAVSAAAQDFDAASGGSTVRVRGAAASADSVSAVAAVEGLHAALARGDSAAVLELLAPDVIILESGDMERRDAYRGHHLPADIEFARAVPGTHTVVGVVVRGDVAWVSSTSVTQGKFKDRAINSAGAELIVLSRRDAKSPWQVRAIHWSSRRRAP